MPPPPPASADYTSLFQYRCLVIDSGPIIRHELSHLAYNNDDASNSIRLYTVPGVVQEIRDSAARQQLASLQQKLIVRTPTASSIQAILAFARKTGDIHSLSSVDTHVLALVYELEKEGCCGSVEHIRTTPKRVLGLGNMKTLGNKSKNTPAGTTAGNEPCVVSDDGVDEDDESEASTSDSEAEAEEINEQPTESVQGQPKSWAALLDPKVKEFDKEKEATGAPLAHVLDEGGQFSDAEEEKEDAREITEAEVDKEYPSLSASLAVPFEGEDDDEANSTDAAFAEATAALELQKAEEEERKKKSLQPISKSGKLYNSFTKYGDLMRPKPKEIRIVSNKSSNASEEKAEETKERSKVEASSKQAQPTSRILGSAIAGQQADDDGAFDDDGEGWVTSPQEIRVMKSNGKLDPTSKPLTHKAAQAATPSGPPLSQRTACATTDFAMQNVLLQMNLELVSPTDGMKVRKLKSWVLRCGACFRVHTSADGTGPLDKRLFCKHCGSDMMQRIAASVDGKSGRLRLHLSKKYRHNLRGTKFSLPKPGSNNRFQGDLLLREDQLLMGAWNQKAKMRSGGKAKSAAESMFGREVATTVGCHARAMTADDIRVGFGRRNPNAAKGRERRGKKKKSVDRACGLRRY